MRQMVLLFLLCFTALLTACNVPQENAEGRLPTGSDQSTADHALLPAEAQNVIPHEKVAYCGNTVTTVTSHLPEGESFTKTFQGDDSVAITDLLRFLNYSIDEVCNCAPEYTIDTEFGTGYALNLSQGYARYQDGQVPLTTQQVESFRQILTHIST